MSANSSRACLRVWSIVESGVFARPLASPSTANRLSPAPVRAATRMRPALCPSSTKLLWPDSVHASLAFVADVVTASSSQRPASSVMASVAIVSPEAIDGSHCFIATSSFAVSSAFVARATVEK